VRLLPTVPDAGPETVTARGSGLIVILADLTWLLLGVAESVPLTLIEYVPFTL
jgi:hypothetical protein